MCVSDELLSNEWVRQTARARGRSAYRIAVTVPRCGAGFDARSVTLLYVGTSTREDVRERYQWQPGVNIADNDSEVLGLANLTSDSEAALHKKSVVSNFRRVMTPFYNSNVRQKQTMDGGHIFSMQISSCGY